MQGVLSIELSGLNKDDLEGALRASHRAEEAQAESWKDLGQKAIPALQQIYPHGATRKRGGFGIPK